MACREFRRLDELLALSAKSYLQLGSLLRHLTVVMQQVDAAGELTGSGVSALREHFAEVKSNCEKLQLPVSLDLTVHLEEQVASDQPNCAAIRYGVEHLERTIQSELSQVVIYYIKPEQCREMDKMYNAMAGLLEKPWPVAILNLDAARRCYAYDQGTASVFHSMRVAERVLTSVAVALGLDTKKENWQNIIEQIEAAIRDLDKLAKGQKRDEQQQFYSEVAMQFRYIKNAWRNHVMHGRMRYVEEQAFEIWWHVKRMVDAASQRLSETD